MENITALVIGGICMLACLTISILQFNERGFLFNNAYIYASKEEREKMDKKPYYRQSAIVFALLTAGFLFIEMEVIFKTGWLLYAEGIIFTIILIYAIISSVQLGFRTKHQHQNK